MQNVCLRCGGMLQRVDAILSETTVTKELVVKKSSD